MCYNSFKVEILHPKHLYFMTSKLTKKEETKNKDEVNENVSAGNTKGGSITVLLTSCLTGLE